MLWQGSCTCAHWEELTSTGANSAISWKRWGKRLLRKLDFELQKVICGDNKMPRGDKEMSEWIGLIESKPYNPR